MYYFDSRNIVKVNTAHEFWFIPNNTKEKPWKPELMLWIVLLTLEHKRKLIMSHAQRPCSGTLHSCIFPPDRSHGGTSIPLSSHWENEQRECKRIPKDCLSLLLKTRCVENKYGNNGRRGFSWIKDNGNLRERKEILKTDLVILGKQERENPKYSPRLPSCCHFKNLVLNYLILLPSGGAPSLESELVTCFNQHSMAQAMLSDFRGQIIKGHTAPAWVSWKFHSLGTPSWCGSF